MKALSPGARGRGGVALTCHFRVTVETNVRTTAAHCRSVLYALRCDCQFPAPTDAVGFLERKQRMIRNGKRRDEAKVRRQQKVTDSVSLLDVGFIRCSPFIGHHVIETIPALPYAVHVL